MARACASLNSHYRTQSRRAKLGKVSRYCANMSRQNGPDIARVQGGSDEGTAKNDPNRPKNGTCCITSRSDFSSDFNAQKKWSSALDGIWAAVVWLGLTHSHIHTHNGEHDMHNVDTTYTKTIADAFQATAKGRTASQHNAAIEDMVFRQRLGMLGTEKKGAFYTLNLLNHILSNEMCSTDTWDAITHCLDEIRRHLGSYAESLQSWRLAYDEAVLNTCMHDLETWKICSERSVCHGVPSKACLGARSDLAWSVMLLLRGGEDREPQIYLGRINPKTIETAIRAAVGR